MTDDERSGEDQWTRLKLASELAYYRASSWRRIACLGNASSEKTPLDWFVN